jgi:vanillate O-demethylase ferredoxin subunit
MTQTIKVKVLHKALVAEEIALMELARSDGGDLPAFSAGAHIDVEIKPGLVRQYSLCNNPSERHRYVLGVLLDPASRGGSVALHQVAQGDEILISAPRNHFELNETAARSLLFAGGIGVTPILCMAEQLAAAGAEFEMHYCARSPSRLAFHDRIKASAFSDRVHLHFDDVDQAQKLNLAQVLGAPQPGVHVYVCGPSGFIDWVLETARANGYAEPQLHREYFTIAAADLSTEGAAFQVKLASTGKVLDVPENKTVMEVLREAGIPVSASCEQGVCGTCLTRVLEGEPDHRDHFLTPEERAANDQFLPCCSRSMSPLLVIDV